MGLDDRGYFMLTPEDEGPLEEIDNRLYIVRNFERVKGGIDTVMVEHVIISDGDIEGEFSYGPYSIKVCGAYLKEDPEGPKKVLLKFSANRKIVEGKSDSKSNIKGFYHGGSISEEIVWLASLFLRRKLSLDYFAKIDGKPALHKIPVEDLDIGIVKGKTLLGEMGGLFKKVFKLKKELHQKYIIAARFYYAALQLIEEATDFAYINLISAIEVLAGNHEVGELQLTDINLGLANCIERIENPELKEEIKKRLLKREGFIKKRFVNFILDYTTADFWEYPYRNEYSRIEPQELEGFLKRIYDIRSAFLHSGEPFPAYIFWSNPYDEELEITAAVIAGNRIWHAEYFIPNLSFFERLVNHVLKTYLIRNKKTDAKTKVKSI